jgi:hypothetical protein
MLRQAQHDKYGGGIYLKKARNMDKKGHFVSN